ncbi:MAG: hypothetical protein C0600_16490 [Ignavibacteria bacterium]|nr:MAG: hypothetical protein C0600_16490 [Ignavibacteria bacterium]
MRKVALPLSERFTVHATGLLNKVHHPHKPKQRDVQVDAIRVARTENFTLRLADEKMLMRRIGL